MTENASSLETQNVDLTLLANFVHQVINPMNGVAGTLDNLIDGTVNEARRGQRTRVARAQLESCITLVRNLAFLVSDPVAVAQSELRTVVLPQIVIEAAMYYQEEGKSKNIEIFLDDRRTQNSVRAHPELIRQVLMNIFDNCVKYSKSDTQVVVSQRVQRSSRMALITVSSMPRHEISGPDLARLFDLGFRGSNARAIIASGTGLGLHICRQLVEDIHGGEIRVQKNGPKLDFMIKLPHAEIG